MYKFVTALLLLLLSSTHTYPMRRCPHLTKSSSASRVPKAAKSTARPVRHELHKFVQEMSYRIPKGSTYAQAGQHIYCHLLALKILHSQHKHKHAAETGNIGKVPTHQCEAYERLSITAKEFEEAFIDNHPNYSFLEFDETDFTPPSQEKLIKGVAAALKDIEDKL